MKKQTIDVLKNFASINQGVLIQPGNVIRTISVQKNVFARATVPDSFDSEFAIYDVNELLSALSLFDAPKLEYKKDHILISSGKNHVRYFYSSKNVVVYPQENPNGPSKGLKFHLTKANLEEVLKAAAIMKLKELKISESGILAFNKSSVGNQYEAGIEDVEGTGEFEVKVELLKVIPDDYDVVCNDVMVYLKSKNGLEYMIARAVD